MLCDDGGDYVLTWNSPLTTPLLHKTQGGISILDVKL